MKTRYNSSNYGNDLRITLKDAQNCSHSGQCDTDVIELLKKQYIKKQVKELNPAQLVKELTEYGAWDSEELSNHNDNILRWVWMSCCDIAEGRN